MKSAPKTPEKMKKEEGTAPNVVTPEKMTPERKAIDEPHDNDVLCGRGGSINCHPGNERYRDLVEKRKRIYLTARFKREKRLIAGGIVNEIYSLNPPGRFLTRDPNDGKWYNIGDEKARDKTSQALRENAPTIRAEIETEINKQREEMRRAEEEEEAARSSWSSHYGYPYQQQSWDGGYYNMDTCYDYGYAPRDQHRPPPPSVPPLSHHPEHPPPPPHSYHGPPYHGPPAHGQGPSYPPPPPHEQPSRYEWDAGDVQSPRPYTQYSEMSSSGPSRCNPQEHSSRSSEDGSKESNWSLNSTYSAYTKNLSFGGPAAQRVPSTPHHPPNRSPSMDESNHSNGSNKRVVQFREDYYGEQHGGKRPVRDGPHYDHGSHRHEDERLQGEHYRAQQQEHYNPEYRPSHQHDREQYSSRSMVYSPMESKCTPATVKSNRNDGMVIKEERNANDNNDEQFSERPRTSSTDIQPANANIRNESQETSILNQFAEGFLSSWDTTNMCIPNVFGSSQTDDRALMDSTRSEERSDNNRPSNRNLASEEQAGGFCRIPSVDEDEGPQDEIEVVEMMDYEHPSEIIKDEGGGSVGRKEVEARTPPPGREIKKVEIYWSNNGNGSGSSWVPDVVSSVNNQQITSTTSGEDYDTCCSIGGESLNKVFDQDAPMNPLPPSGAIDVDGIGSLGSPDMSHRGLKVTQSWEKSFRDNDDGSTVSRDDMEDHNFVKSPKIIGGSSHHNWEDSTMISE